MRRSAVSAIFRLITSAPAALDALHAPHLLDHDHPDHRAFAALGVGKDVGGEHLFLFWNPDGAAPFWSSDPDVKFWRG